MFSKHFNKTLAEIKSLRIQGAENVASQGLSALSKEMLSFTGTSKSFLQHLRQATIELKNTRPTEPALRNSLRFVLFQAQKNSASDVEVLKKLVFDTVSKYEKHSLESKQKIAEYGANLVPKNGVVLTHCHSGTVMRSLKKAFDQKKNFRAICLETRPLFQGRITAKELSDYGIPTTLMVDSGVSQAVRKADVCFVGSDAITASGDLVNKVGTEIVALACQKREVPIYSRTGLHKFDMLTLWGEEEPIEVRSASEVLDEKTARQAKINLKKLSVLNPAFDFVDHLLIEAYITEYGVCPPQGLRALAEKYLQ